MVTSIRIRNNEMDLDLIQIGQGREIKMICFGPE